jgi:hypothetical protein
MKKSSWIKFGLYVASGLSGLFAVIFPPAAVVLVPVGTFLGGLATRTPGEAPTVVGPAPQA